MIRKWRNQKETPTPQFEGWEKTKMTHMYLYIKYRVNSYFQIGGHSVTRT